jgi:hypothetical protein
LVEYPLVTLNQQLDAAMREKTDNTSVDFMFPPLQALIGNINSLLTRYIHGEGAGSAGGIGGFVNKDGEAENLVQLIGFPAIAISKDGRIMAGSPSFGQVARTEVAQLIGQAYQAIPDVALQQNIDSLMGKTRENPRVIHTDQLEFNGHPCVLSCQGMSSQPGEIDYFVITISPAEGGS